MNDILGTYDSVSLDEMKRVRLMNRIDTKYVTTLPVLIALLQEAKEAYRVQSTGGLSIMPYYTLYYDTADSDMYREHLRGRKRRQKIRIRRYEASELSFLEVKNKNNKGRTEKIRIPFHADDAAGFGRFIGEHSRYPWAELSQRIENRFSRITLVNRNFTERLTIDTQIRFHNLVTESTCLLDGLVVIELKREGNTPSPIVEILRRLRVHPAKFSKYCMGMALTDGRLGYNRFKPRLRMIGKMCGITEEVDFLI